MLIAEDLLLLATDDVTGKTTVSSIELDPALAGAVLIELVVAGRVTLEGDGRQAAVVVTDTTPLGDPVLDTALQTLIEKGPAETGRRHWPAREGAARPAERPTGGPGDPAPRGRQGARHLPHDKVAGAGFAL